MQHSLLTKTLNKPDVEESYINKSGLYMTNQWSMLYYMGKGRKFSSDIKNKTKVSFLTTLLQYITESFKQSNEERNKRNTKR